MRLLELHLRNFGRFRNVSLPFAQSKRLHVVYGPNEAGKSTTLDAIEAFLFGFPHRTQEGFVERGSEVGATLLASDGASVSLVRRKGREPSLTDIEGNRQYGKVLDPFLHGVTRDEFEQFYSLGMERLLNATHRLLGEGGRLGELLFDLHLDRNPSELSMELENRASTLYRGRKGTGKLGEALKEYESYRKMLVIGDARDYGQKCEELSELQSNIDQREKEQIELQRELRRYRALCEARPSLAKRLQARSRLETLGTPPPLSDEFERSYLVHHRASVEHAAHLAVWEHQRRELEGLLENLTVDRSVLTAAEEVSELASMVRDYSSRRASLPVLRSKIAEFSRACHEIHLGVWPHLTSEEASAISITSAVRLSINTLLKEAHGLGVGLDAAEKALHQGRWKLEMAKDDLEKAEDVEIPVGLEDAINYARSTVEVERARRDSEIALQSLRAEIDSHIARLAPFRGDAAELRRLAVPGKATIRRYEEESRELGRAKSAFEREVAELERERTATVQRRDGLLQRGEVPTQAALDTARTRRGQLWGTIYESWIMGAPILSPDELATQFVEAMSVVDALSDGLREEAIRIAELQNLDEEIVKAESRLLAARAQIEHLTEATRDLAHRWQNEWPAFQDKLRAPPEMAEWLENYHHVLSASLREEQLALEVEKTGELLEGVRVRLAAVGIDRRGASIAELIPEADRKLTQLRSARQHRVACEAAHEEAQREVRRLEHDLCRVREHFARWDLNWREKTAALRLETSSCEEVEICLEQLAKREQLYTQRTHAVRTLEVDQEFVQRFEARESELVSKIAPALIGSEPGTAVRRLEGLVAGMQERETERRNLQRELEQRRQDERSAREALALAKAHLESLRGVAGCETLEEIPAAITRWRECTAESTRLQDADEQLRILGGPECFESFLRAAEDADESELRARIVLLESSYDRQHREISELHRSSGVLQKEIDGYRTSGRLLEIQGEAEQTLARITTAHEEYITLKLASKALSSFLEEYRRQNEQPILRKASHFFSSLTDGGFKELRSEFDEDHAYLTCVRSSGEARRVDELSSGTAAAVYLALRLACISYDAEQRGDTVPLILDDILVDFDDERAYRALHTLAEFGEITQVIFFSHHDHLVNMAAAALGDAVEILHLPR